MQITGSFYWDVTALHVACISGRADAVRYLLEVGADPFKQDGQGRTVMYYAATHVMCYECMRVLIKHGLPFGNISISRLELDRWNLWEIESGQDLYEHISLFLAAGGKLKFTEDTEEFQQEMTSLIPDLDTYRVASLQHWSRQSIRTQLLFAHSETNLFHLIPKLNLPGKLHHYLLYNHNMKCNLLEAESVSECSGRKKVFFSEEIVINAIQ